MTKGITCPECRGHGFIDKHEIREDLGPDTAISTMTEEVCSRCHGTGCALVPMTNADRIRAMSDENMAQMLFEAMDGTVEGVTEQLGIKAGLDTFVNVEGYKESILEWLRKPAGE